MKRRKKLKFKLPDLFVMLVVIGYSTYMFFQARGFRKADINLTLIGPLYYAILFFAVLRLIQCISLETVEEEKTELSPLKERITKYIDTNRELIIMMIAAVVYAIGFKYIGFYITTVIVFPVTMYFLGVKKKIVIALVTAGTMLFFYLGFVVWLGVRLP